MDRVTSIPGSVPSISSQLNLFELPPSDVSQVSSGYSCIYPIYSISQKTAPVEFNYVGDQLHYTDLSKSFVYLRAKITKADGNPIPAEEVVSPINLTAHSLWDACELFINGTLVSRSSSLYAYKAIIQRELANGMGVKASFMQEEFYSKDNLPGTYDNTNTGFLWRRTMSKESTSFELIGRPVEALFQQNRLLPPNTDIRLRFRRNPDQFVLEGAKSTEATFPYSLVIQEAAFYPYKVIVNPEIHTQQLARLSGGESALYPIRFADVKSFAIPSGSSNYISEAVYAGKLPEKLIITFVDSLAYAGSLETCPFKFEDFGCSSITVSIDNEAAIYRNIDVDVTDNKYLLGFHTLQGAVAETNEGNYITREDYTKGHFFTVFDLTATGFGNRFSPDRTGSVKLEIKFKANLSKSVHALIYGQFQGLVKIDGSKNVSLEYTS